MRMGRMTNHAFYDSILKENRIPIEMVRALLTKQKPRRETAFRVPTSVGRAWYPNAAD